MKFSLSLLALLVLVASGLQTSAEPERIHFWLKGFIPNQHLTNPNYVRPIPGQAGKFMIPGPIGEACFFTDHRSFSSDPMASARITTEFDIVIDGTTARIEKSSGREVHRCDLSAKVDCTTGQIIQTATGKPRTAVFGESFGIGRPQLAGNQIQVIFQTGASNPLTPPGSPDIDASIDLLYDRGTGDLQFKASLGAFPAFEAYAAKNGGSPVALFTVAPIGKSVWSLFDGGLGLNARSLSGTVALGSPLDGVWFSTDPKKRFSLDIRKDAVVMTERSEDGKQLRRSSTLQPAASGKFRINRTNDDEVLQFFGFSPELRAAVLANSSAPSFFEIERHDDRLLATWHGFLVIKDAKGRFKELKQPGVAPARGFEFSK